VTVVFSRPFLPQYHCISPNFFFKSIFHNVQTLLNVLTSLEKKPATLTIILAKVKWKLCCWKWVYINKDLLWCYIFVYNSI